MEKNKRLINLKFGKVVAHGNEGTVGRGFTDIDNVLFLKLRMFYYFSQIST